MCVCVHVHACVRACVCVLQHQDVLLHAEDESSVGSQFEILILHHIIHLHQLTNVLCVWGVHVGEGVWNLGWYSHCNSNTVSNCIPHSSIGLPKCMEV